MFSTVNTLLTLLVRKRKEPIANKEVLHKTEIEEALKIK